MAGEVKRVRTGSSKNPRRLILHRQAGRRRHRRHNAADFGEPLQAPDQGIAWMGAAADVVEQLVAVVGAERDPPRRVGDDRRRRRRPAALSSHRIRPCRDPGRA